MASFPKIWFSEDLVSEDFRSPATNPLTPRTSHELARSKAPGQPSWLMIAYFGALRHELNCKRLGQQ
jgi:hypothetical protein